MKRLLPVVAGASVLVAIGLVAAVAITASPATSADRVERIAGVLRCPDCEALSVAESRTSAAGSIRTEIERQVAAGLPDDEIRAYFAERYGEWILMEPADPVAWWLPALVILVAVGVFIAWLVGPGPRRDASELPTAATPATDADRQRVRDELELLDG